MGLSIASGMHGMTPLDVRYTLQLNHRFLISATHLIIPRLELTSGIMGKMKGMICHTYYHTERIVGGENIFYYDINLGVKTF